MHREALGECVQGRMYIAKWKRDKQEVKVDSKTLQNTVCRYEHCGKCELMLKVDIRKKTSEKR